MKRKIKLFVIYFPVILVACQVSVNILYFISPEWYFASGFYLNTFFGTNVLFAVFLVIFTMLFRFCAISRWSAFAELLFALYYLVIQKDDVYNIVFQISSGGFAIVITCIHYVKKFPFCRLSLLISFFSSIFSTGSCADAMRDWDSKIEHKIDKHILNKRTHEYNP